MADSPTTNRPFASRCHTMPSAPAAGKRGGGAGRTSVSQSLSPTGHSVRLRCPHPGCAPEPGPESGAVRDPGGRRAEGRRLSVGSTEALSLAGVLATDRHALPHRRRGVARMLGDASVTRCADTRSAASRATPCRALRPGPARVLPARRAGDTHFGAHRSSAIRHSRRGSASSTTRCLGCRWHFSRP